MPDDHRPSLPLAESPSAAAACPVEEMLGQVGLVPVIVIDDAAAAGPLAQALVDVGLPILEITLRSPAGLAAVAAVAGAGDCLVGAGTVLSRDAARQAIQAGAQFIVSPGLDVDTVHYCRDRGIPIFPGVCTASEAQQAVNLGLKIVKFFPAQAFGGAATIKALGGPFPQLKFLPTGGIGLEDLDSYFALPSVLAVGGSWMVPSRAIQQQHFDQITQLARTAVQTVRSLRS